MHPAAASPHARRAGIRRPTEGPILTPKRTAVLAPALALSLLLPALLLPEVAVADDGLREARSTLPLSRRAEPASLTRRGGPISTPTAIEGLREAVQGIWSGRILRRGVTAVHIVDAETGEELYTAHADDQLNPASNVKLVSTATVLDTLGPDWRFHTRLFGAMPTTDGTVHGGVYLRGHYDPTFGTRSLASLVEELAARGVRRIDGDVVLSDDAVRDTLATGTVQVTVRGAGVGQPPTVEVSPASEFVTVDVRAKTTRRGRTRVRVGTTLEEDAGFGPRLRVAVTGRIRRGHRRVLRRGVHRRSTFTGHTVRAALADAGIEVTGSVRLLELDAFLAESVAAGRLPIVLAEHQSRPIGDLIARVNKRSINWLSDRLIMVAAAQRYGGGLSMDKAVRMMKDWLAKVGVDPEEVLIDTGSGLSYNTQLTARQIVRVLRAGSGYAGDATGASTFLSSLAVGGVDGTLRHRFRGSPARGEVLAKTGTLTGVIALSGFVAGKGGRTLCFAIVTNGNRHRKRNQVRREHEAIVEQLHSFLDTAPPRPAPEEPALEPDEAIAAADDDALLDAELDEVEDTSAHEEGSSPPSEDAPALLDPFDSAS